MGTGVTGEQAHLEGLAPELEPGQWIDDGAVYRIERMGGISGWELPVIVRRFAPPRRNIFDAYANLKKAWAIYKGEH
jgi:hypothetical protein